MLDYLFIIVDSVKGDEMLLIDLSTLWQEET